MTDRWAVVCDFDGTLTTEDLGDRIAIELEGHCYSRLRQSDDFKEGVEAFHAKRPAKFKGS